MKQITLYRPVGKAELLLIAESGFLKFPPRLSWQPIFYPVLNSDYAAKIITDWNVKDEFSGYMGAVTAFSLPADYVSTFEVKNVGDKGHNELWIPAEELDVFNEKIIGKIEVIELVFGEKYVDDSTLIKELDRKIKDYDTKRITNSISAGKKV